MSLNLLFVTAISGLTAVAMGAFGAHGLKAVLTAEMMAVYKTAVDYHMWHALALGLIALLKRQAEDSRCLSLAGGFMFAGILLFSGSLYLLAVLNMKWLGMITPIGGICFLLGWGMLAFFAYKQGKVNRPL